MARVIVVGGWGDFISYHLLASLLWLGIGASFWPRGRPWLRGTGLLLVIVWCVGAWYLGHAQMVIETH